MMMRYGLMAVAVVLAAGTAGRAEMLFNGKDLSGWTEIGSKDAWSVENGILKCNGKKDGYAWLSTDRKYGNFVIDLEWKVGPEGNTGVFLRAPDREGRTSMKGFEVQCRDDAADKDLTDVSGAVFSRIPGNGKHTRPVGEWNHLRVTCIGREVRIELNGNMVSHRNMDDIESMRVVPDEGYIGLQNHGQPAEFRNIRLMELTPKVDPAKDVPFRMITINGEAPYEGVGVFDISKDDRLDIISGAFWYEAPAWKKHDVREVKPEGGYHLSFSDLPLDVNSDGCTDTINSAWHDRKLSWIKNPCRPDQKWEEIAIDTPGNMETAMLADVNGDGRPDILPNVAGSAAWYELKQDAGAPYGVKFVKHDLPKQVSGHGLGAGDVNGDGKLDIVGHAGWAEQGATPDEWIWHGEFELGAASIPIPVHDVDGDGDADLVWGMGHDYGLFWLEQVKNEKGERAWKRHEIDKSFSQAHVVLMADVDGDGSQDIVTGKRYWAHNGHDPGARDPRCLYYYTFNKTDKTWTRHTIHEGGPAGTGTQASIIDIDKDGDLDLVMPGKSGLYLFQNLRDPGKQTGQATR